MSSLSQDEHSPIQDHCGIVAAFAAHDVSFFEKGLAGLTILQTRGYDGAGFCACDEKGHLTEHKGVGMVREVFSPAAVAKLGTIHARNWVYQVRYGTSGNFIPKNVQPIVGKHIKTGEVFMVAHNGQFSKSLDEKSDGESDTMQFVRELSDAGGKSWDERIVSVLHRKHGAWSLVVSTKDALFVARDPFGFRPFTYGHLWDHDTKQFIWVAASETSALDVIGITDHFELLPGTIAKISREGLTILSKKVEKHLGLCIFENIYLHHGAGKAHLPRTNQRAIKKSPTVDEVRRRSGKILAREAPLSTDTVDMVIGVPGTGIEGGMAYARVLDIPYFQAITDKAKSLTEQRTFMTADIDSIYKKVLDHFCFDAQALNGRRVVLVDDSIVRGNITKGLVYLLKNHYHVLAVHLRIVSPAIDKSCHMGVNTRSADELIAFQLRGDVRKIQEFLHADSLAYLSPHGLKEAITGNPNADGFCMGCMVGNLPPIDAFGHATPVVRQKRIGVPIKSPSVSRSPYILRKLDAKKSFLSINPSNQLFRLRKLQT